MPNRRSAARPSQLPTLQRQLAPRCEPVGSRTCRHGAGRLRLDGPAGFAVLAQWGGRVHEQTTRIGSRTPGGRPRRLVAPGGDRGARRRCRRSDGARRRSHHQGARGPDRGDRHAGQREGDRRLDRAEVRRWLEDRLLRGHGRAGPRALLDAEDDLHDHRAQERHALHRDGHRHQRARDECAVAPRGGQPRRAAHGAQGHRPGRVHRPRRHLGGPGVAGLEADHRLRGHRHRGQRLL